MESRYGHESADSEPVPVRWQRRPPERTSRISKAACLLTAGFALSALLGTAPVTTYAQEASDAALQAESQNYGGADADMQDVHQSQHEEHALYTEPPHMAGESAQESGASVSLAAAYVSEERDEEEGSAGGGGSDEEDKGSAKLDGIVVSSVSAGSPAVSVSDDQHLAAAHTAIITVSEDDTAALSVTGGATADLSAGSAVSASGVRSIAASASGEGSKIVLDDSSAYAAGSGCAALEASDGAAISMQGGALESEGGCAVRIEGTGSSVSLAGTEIFSEGGFAELVGDGTLSLDNVTATSRHAPALYVAAGMPKVSLQNGSVISGSVIVAPGADIEIETDMTSRLDGSIVYLS